MGVGLPARPAGVSPGGPPEPIRHLLNPMTGPERQSQRGDAGAGAVAGPTPPTAVQKPPGEHQHAQIAAPGVFDQRRPIDGGREVTVRLSERS